MSHPHAPGPRRAPSRVGLRLFVAGAACALVGLSGWSPAQAAPAAPAAPSGLVWTVAWTAPVTKAGPNRFTAAPQLKGTAKYLLGGISRVDYTINGPAGLPASCGAFPRTGVATVAGASFTVAPELPCNGTYSVSVVAQSGSGVLAARSSALTAPVSLADPGGAVTGARGATDDASRTVSLAWTADPDPDVTGYVIRRDGADVAQVDRTQSTWVGTAPGVGTFSYDISALRWGDAGPGSLPLVSAPSAPLAATIEAVAAPGPGSKPGSKPGTIPGSTPGTTTPGAKPGSGSSAAGGSLPTVPTADAKVDPRSGYRSGGTISSSSSSSRRGGSSSTGSSTSAEEPDVYEERLPYEDQTSVRGVEVSSPDRTEIVRSTVAVPSRTKPGLLVPLAVVLVLLAASLQVRSLLGRAGDQVTEGADPA